MAHFCFPDDDEYENNESLIISIKDKVRQFLKVKHQFLIGQREKFHSQKVESIKKGVLDKMNNRPSSLVSNDFDTPKPRLTNSDDHLVDLSNLHQGVVSIDITNLSFLETLQQQASANEWDVSKVRNFISPFREGHSTGHNSLVWWDRPLWAWKWNELLIGNGAMISVEMAECLCEMPLSIKLLVSNSKEISSSAFAGELKCRMYIEKQAHFRLKSAFSDEVSESEDDNEGEKGKSTTILKQSTVALHDDIRNESPAGLKLLKESHLMTDANEAPEKSQHGNESSAIPNISDKTNEKMSKAGDRIETCEGECCLLYSNDIGDYQNNEEVTMSSTDKNKYNSQIQHRKSPKSVMIAPEKSSQIDSQGIDLSMLSQLPPHLRSETRLALAVREQQRQKKRPRPPANSQLHQWLSSSSDVTKGTSRKALLSPTFSPSSAKKQSQTIKDFFSSG
jgi:hypothetical protein